MGCNPNDILYDTLPLYHTVGGMIALGGTMKHGITGKSFSEALILASTNPQYHYDDRLFIELQVQYMKIPSSNLGRTFLTFRTIFVRNMFSPCSVKRRASDKDLPVTGRFSSKKENDFFRLNSQVLR